MKNKDFMDHTSDWLDRFISTYNRGPRTYEEYIQFCMDSMVDAGVI